MWTDEVYEQAYQDGYADAMADVEAKRAGYSRVTVYIDPKDGLLTSDYQPGDEPHAVARLMSGLADAHEQLMSKFWSEGDENDDDCE